MTTRRPLLLGLLTLLALLPLLAPRAAGAQPGGQQCFAETGFCISGPILSYWRNNGALPVFGYPISAQQVETVEGRTIQVQWFERDRLEIQADGAITAGRLGARSLELSGRAWQRGPEMPYNPDCTFVAETGHNMCGLFRAYWQQNGGLARFGYPITDPIEETIEGKPYWVQYFERRRMEYHPTQGGTSYQAMVGEVPATVLLGLLGRDVFTRERSGGCAAPLPELATAVSAFNRDIPLGCPIRNAGWSGLPGATAQFERGVMYWLSTPSGPVIYALAAQRGAHVTYRGFADTWREGDPATVGLNPPAGLYEPARGFGKVWRDNPELQRLLGWALEPEHAVTVSFQAFEYGMVMLVAEEGQAWQLTPPDRARSLVVQR
jgi:hypothetical protein